LSPQLTTAKKKSISQHAAINPTESFIQVSGSTSRVENEFHDSVMEIEEKIQTERSPSNNTTELISDGTILHDACIEEEFENCGYHEEEHFADSEVEEHIVSEHDE